MSEISINVNRDLLVAGAGIAGGFGIAKVLEKGSMKPGQVSSDVARVLDRTDLDEKAVSSVKRFIQSGDMKRVAGESMPLAAGVVLGTTAYRWGREFIGNANSEGQREDRILWTGISAAIFGLGAVPITEMHLENPSMSSLKKLGARSLYALPILAGVAALKHGHSDATNRINSK